MTEIERQLRERSKRIILEKVHRLIDIELALEQLRQERAQILRYLKGVREDAP